MMERHADPVTLDDLIRLRKENERYLKAIDQYKEALHSIMDLCDSMPDEKFDQRFADIWEIAVTGLGIRPHYL